MGRPAVALHSLCEEACRGLDRGPRRGSGPLQGTSENFLPLFVAAERNI